MQGYLIKRKRLGALKLFTCYTKRYFILNSEDLIFTYSIKEGGQPKEVIPMTVSDPCLAIAWLKCFVENYSCRCIEQFHVEASESQAWVLSGHQGQSLQPLCRNQTNQKCLALSIQLSNNSEEQVQIWDWENAEGEPINAIRKYWDKSQWLHSSLEGWSIAYWEGFRGNE